MQFKHQLFFLLTGFIGLFAVNSALAQSTDKSELESCQTEACALQFKNMEKFARRGSPHAQGILAAMLLNGYGAQKDVERAVGLLKKAVRLGGSYYRNQLGLMYLTGEFVAQDTAEGLRWLERSAAEEDGQALYLLGSIYASGIYVKRDVKHSQILLERAVEAGNDKANTLLGMLYEAGELGERDLHRAADYYEKAAAKDVLARQRLRVIAPERVVSFPVDSDIEIITVTPPPLEEMVTDGLAMIREQGIYTGRGSTAVSRIKGRSCVADGSCVAMVNRGVRARNAYYSGIRRSMMDRAFPAR